MPSICQFHRPLAGQHNHSVCNNQTRFQALLERQALHVSFPQWAPSGIDLQPQWTGQYGWVCSGRWDTLGDIRFAGLWFIQKFRKAASLTQLSMKDATNIRQTFLYQLSKEPGLEHFRNVLLCGSSQDYYVPIHSAHIELCNAALTDSSDNGTAAY